MDTIQKNLVVVWLALLMLLGATISASYLVTGAASVLAGLGIAFAKAVLILWFFMQLHGEKGLLRVFATGAVVWLLILLVLSAIDYTTR